MNHYTRVSDEIDNGIACNGIAMGIDSRCRRWPNPYGLA